MQKIWNDFPLPFLSPTDAMHYLQDSPYIDSLPTHAKETLYELVLTARPMLKPRAMIDTFPVIDNEIDFGFWKYSLPLDGHNYQKISLLVVALADNLHNYIEDLALQNPLQAAMLDAIAWDGLMQSSNYLFEMILHESFTDRLQIVRQLPWPEDFIESHQKEIASSLHTEKIDVSANESWYIFWGAVGWVL